MSNTKPTQQPSEPSGEVEQEPELIDANGVEGDVQQEQEQEQEKKKKDDSKVHKKVNNGSVKKPRKEGKKFVHERGERKKPSSWEEISKTSFQSMAVRGEKRKRPSREEISKTREEKRVALRDAKRKAKVANKK